MDSRNFGKISGVGREGKLSNSLDSINTMSIVSVLNLSWQGHMLKYPMPALERRW